MNPFKLLTTPEFFYRPRQVLHRFRRMFIQAPDIAEVTLPWGDRLRVRPREVIGSSIWCYGVFDLVVTEAICRLLDEGEVALDIGANIGQMASLMRRVAGANGNVVAFEPHPHLFAELQEFLAQSATGGGRAPVKLHQVGLSNRETDAFLAVGKHWDDNRGSAQVVTGAGKADSRLIKIRLATLDQILPTGTRVGVCKIDVEGHEMPVLQGAERLFEERAVRDIILEEHHAYPAPTHRLLMAHGYAIYALHMRLRKPLILPAAEQTAHFSPRYGANYLATLDPVRTEQRYAAAGWKSLTGGVGAWHK